MFRSYDDWKSTPPDEIEWHPSVESYAIALEESRMKAAEQLNAIIDSAEQHGLDSDPAHEIGDLQDALKACWKNMSEAQHLAAFASLSLWGDQ